MIVNNLYRKIFPEKEVFYDAVEYQDIPIDEVFKAQYKYGPEEEQIIKKNIIINFFQTLIARLLKSFVYPGSSRKWDKNRILKTKHQLKAMGGKFLTLKTPDGDTLEGVFLKASDFKTSIENYFYVLKERTTFRNSSEKIFGLRNKFCNKTHIGSTLHITPNLEAKEFIEHLEGLKFTNTYFGALPLQTKWDSGVSRKIIDYLESFFIDKLHGFNLPFHSFAREINNLPTIDEKRTSNPTVIIAGGNNATYGSYKDFAIHYLARGLDVMMINPRGYGESTGTPTSHKTKLDLETAYQYLSDKKKVENKDLLVHGHCLGGGSATDLAARRTGVNLLLDRSFATFHEEAKATADYFCNDPKFILKETLPRWEKFFDKVLPDEYIKETRWGKIRNKITVYAQENEIAEKLTTFFAKIMSWGIEYNNTDHLKKIKGKIGLVIDIDDEIIQSNAGDQQECSCREKTVIRTNVGHNSFWLNTTESPSWASRFFGKRDENDFSEEFNQFLINANLYRKVF